MPSIPSAAILETGARIDHFKRSAMARRLRVMERLGVDVVLDVGANRGQYARKLRRCGYAGDITSFEPCARPRRVLERHAARDARWKVAAFGLGNEDREATIHVSGDSRSSSLLPMMPLHEGVAGYFAKVGEETIRVHRLDTVFDDHVAPGARVLLKLDVQGFERQAIAGAEASLGRVVAVQMEMSLRRLYEGEMLLPEAIASMEARGFSLVSIEYGFCHPETGEMLQVDGVFVRG